MYGSLMYGSLYSRYYKSERWASFIATITIQTFLILISILIDTTFDQVQIPEYYKSGLDLGRPLSPVLMRIHYSCI